MNPLKMWLLSKIITDVGEPIIISNYPYIKEVIKSKEIVESIVTNKRELKNNGNVKLIQEITVSEEISKTYNIEYEKSSVNRQEFSVSSELLKSIKADIKEIAEETIKQKYGTSKGIKKTYTHKITVEVPPFERVILYLHWKRVWLSGSIVMCTGFETELKIPFNTVIEVFCEPETKTLGKI
jgi:hypothetical protein